MSILDGLSSQVGDRTEYSNRKTSLLCLERPSRIAEIVAGLDSGDEKLAGDCAEVLTMVAESSPERASPYASALGKRLDARTARLRWEAVHALSLIAPCSPRAISRLLPQLGAIIRDDPSVIARDYAVDTVGNYAATGPGAAEKAFPYLKEALTTWEGKQAGHALNGLGKLVRAAPKYSPQARELAEGFLGDRRGVVQKAAKALIKEIDNRK